tara:strand:+ start:364 stop:1305 length:942 start_codon:yes stop_codon:yes gene_type:complete
MDCGNQCLSVFKNFIQDIIKVFPEYKLKLEDVYMEVLLLESCQLDQQELLLEFLDRVHKLNKKITNKDESVFDEDPMILTDISFKHMWSTNISDKTKEAIWKYLQTFCLLAINHKSSQDLQSALSDLSDNKEIDIKDKNVASDVKKIKKMTENMQEPLPEPSPEPEGSNPLENMEQMMLQSDIGKIAQEVSQSLDIESMLDSDSDNPMEVFQKLMSGDGLGKIMNTIHTTVSQKVDTGEIDQEAMVQQAQSMYQSMGQNPMFQALSMMQGMQGMQGQGQGMPEPAQPRNKTQERLQKKLKQRKAQVKVTKDDQ